MFSTEIRDLNPVDRNADGEEIFEIRLGELIPVEIWEMNIEAVRVGGRIIRNPDRDQMVTAASICGGYDAFASTTIWIADGVRWIVGSVELLDDNQGYWTGVRWTVHPRPQPTRPPIPAE